MRALALALTLSALPAASPAAAPDCVVLLHGLARGPTSMEGIATALDLAGYRVVNRGYPSTDATVAQLAADHVGPAVAACGAARVHFVTHSMGGILVRAWLAGNRPDSLGNVVMLAPPNQGSELVDRLGHLAPFAWANGPAGAELGTGPDGVAARLPAPDYPVLVIAGNRSMNQFYSAMIPGPDDGKVSVASTRLPGLADHLTLPVTHTFLMWSPLVMAEVLHGLEHGRFAPDLGTAEAVRGAALGN